MKLKSLAISALVAAGGLLGAAHDALAQAKEQFFPVLVYRTGAYAPNGVPFANGYVDYFKLINARGGINGVKIIWEECETGYATDRGRRMLRAPEGQERRRHGVPAAVHRHHLRADREGAGRQDPAHHRRLRPQRKHRRQRLQVELPAHRHLLGRRRHPGAARRQEGRRPGQAQGQEDRARLPRQPLRQGADPAAGGTRQAARLRAAAAAGDAPGRGAEGHLAADPPEPPGLRVPVGLGRDELHRAEGGGGHRLPARQDVRRVVGRRRAGRQGRRRRRQGLQRAWRCSTAPSRTPRSSRTCSRWCTPRARAPGRRKRSARCCTCAA